MSTFNKTIFVFFMAFATLLTSCKKDDDGGDGPQGGTGTFKAKIDGTGFSGMDGTVVARLSSSGNGKILAVSGGTSSSQNLQMIISGFDGEGTYNLNFMNIGTYSYLPDPSNPDPNSVVIYSTGGNGQSNNGTLKVSSYDGETVKGTFNFTGFNLDDMNDKVIVSDGEFNIAVTNQ